MSTASRDYVPVSVINRILGAIIDIFVMLIPLLVAFAVFSIVGDKFASAFSGVLVWAVYEVVMYTKSGKTVGKGVVNARVTSDPATLALPTAQQAFIRSIARNGAPLSIIATFVPIFGIFVIGWALAIIITTLADPMKRGLHDKIAGTYIVSVAPGAIVNPSQGQSYTPPESPQQPPSL